MLRKSFAVVMVIGLLLVACAPAAPSTEVANLQGQLATAQAGLAAAQQAGGESAALETQVSNLQSQLRPSLPPPPSSKPPSGAAV
jgi:outer membrane PBP1 activator LpoA protein